MTLTRLLLPACLAAFAAAIVRAESEQSPRFKDNASPDSPSLVSPMQHPPLGNEKLVVRR